MSVRLLPWDSKFFGMQIGEYEASAGTDASLDFSGFDLVYVKSSAQQELAAEGFSVTYSEQKRVYSKSLGTFAGSYRDDAISGFSNLEDIPQLRKLAYESGKFSRFRLDPRFPERAFFDLYDCWVEKSIDKTFADNIFIYKQNDRAEGFCTLRILEGVGYVGLIAVSPESQGKGVGSALLSHSEMWLAENGVRELRIPTQSVNDAACKFYEAKGYALYEASCIQHFWKL